jgi:DNA-binding response OmpR family regulator
MTYGRVLVVDDDANLRELLVSYLQDEGYAVLAAASARAAQEAATVANIDLILLDVRLPDGDGFDLLQELRRLTSTPIIMLTGRDSPADRIVGLELGADDFIGKPFELGELRARMRSVLRRSYRFDDQDVGTTVETLSFTGWTVDLTHRRLLNPANDEVDLTSGEFDLLRVLAEHPQRPLSRDQLLDLTRSREWSPFDRSVDVLIGRLRRKMAEKGDNLGLIKTIRNVGYALTADVRRRRQSTPGSEPPKPPALPR